MPITQRIGGRDYEVVNSRNLATLAAYDLGGTRKVASGPMISIIARLAAGPADLSTYDREQLATFDMAVRPAANASLESEARAMLDAGMSRDAVNAKIAAKGQLFEAEAPIRSVTYLAPVRYN